MAKAQKAHPFLLHEGQAFTDLQRNSYPAEKHAGRPVLHQKMKEFQRDLATKNLPP
jgi:hypothetical protein